MDQNTDFDPDIHVDSANLSLLTDQKNELLAWVQTLKKELGDWRAKLDTQVKTYRVVCRVCWRCAESVQRCKM